MDWGILFMGPVGAGKTQAIDSISDIDVVNTDVRATDDTRRVKTHTTVAMDMGVLHLADSDKLRLYGAPGQSRFDFMWDILLQQSKGVVLLVNHASPTALADLDFYLEVITQRMPDRDLPMVIGITHMDESPADSLLGYHRHIRRKRVVFGGVEPPLFSVDARQRDHVRCLLMAMVAQLEMAERFPKVAARALAA